MKKHIYDLEMLGDFNENHLGHDSLELRQRFLEGRLLHAFLLFPRRHQIVPPRSTSITWVRMRPSDKITVRLSPFLGPAAERTSFPFSSSTIP